MSYILLCFLSVLLVPIWFTVSNRLVNYFRLLKHTQWKNNDYSFTSVIAFSKRDCPLVWKLVEYTLLIRSIYVKTFIAKQANKL